MAVNASRSQRHLTAFLRTAFQASVCAVIAVPASGQESAEPQPGDLINYPYHVAHGFGRYDIAAQHVRLIQARPGIWLRSPAKHPWGLKLVVSAVFGVYDFSSDEDLAFDISAFALLPGVEAELPLSRTWTLKPFVQIGAGKDFEGGDLAFIFYTGLKNEFVFPWKRFEFGVEPLLEYTFSRSPKTELNEDFGTLAVTLDARHPLWFKIRENQPDFGVYFSLFEYGLVVDKLKLDFAGVGGESTIVSNQFEVGASFGSVPPFRLWFFNLPRLSVGYHWGDDLTGLRIRLGGRQTQPRTN